VAEVVIVGGGVGGLAAAIRLGAAGHHVTLLERNANLGGKLAERERDGFHFDVGPTSLTMPELFESLFELSGSTLDQELDLVRLDPQVRYTWPDGSTLDVRDDGDATAKAFEELVTGSGEAYRQFDERGRMIWDTSERALLAARGGGAPSLSRRLRAPRDLAAIDGWRSLSSRARRSFTDPRLVQWVERYATCSGTAPRSSPAALVCLPHIESTHGVWFPMGGMGRLRDALVRAARRAGATLRPGVDVEAIEHTGHQVSAVRTTAGERIAADVVVTDADAEHVYADLAPVTPLVRRVRRGRRSLSAIVIAAGVRGRTEGIAHHNVWFSSDPRAEFRQIALERRPAEEPTISATVSVVTDATLAPAGDENWLLLVHAPPGAAIDPGPARDRALMVLADRGVDLRDRLHFTEVMVPADIAERYRSPGGALYGTAAHRRLGAFTGVANRGPLRGLYLVGGSAYPGGGLPFVLIGARTVDGLIRDDGW
jgi:phytoene desaturase